MAQASERRFTVRSWRRVFGRTPTGAGQPLAASDVDLAEDYHEASKFYKSTFSRLVDSSRVLGDQALMDAAAAASRDLPHRIRVELPPAPADPTYPTLVRGPSTERFALKPVPVELLGPLLWLSYGEYPESATSTGEADEPSAPPPAALPNRRPVASGGALYPLEIYAIADIGDGGQRRVYHYSPSRHALEDLGRTISPDVLPTLGPSLSLFDNVPVILLIMGMFPRARFKYGLRGYRFAVMEAGAVTQQIQLAAQALGLGSLPYAGLFDDVVEDVCGIDGVDESFINAVLVGFPDG